MRLRRSDNQPQPTDPGLDKVRRLIADRLVTPVYQPIVDLHRLEIAGREALARPAAESGFKSPAEYFDEIERVGLVWEGEKVTRDAAVAGFAESADASRLFLNASPAVIADDRLTDDLLRSVLAVKGLSPTRLVVEITERSEQSYTDVIVTRAEELRRQGFEIAVDDVGAGTSGLNRIMAIRPDWIKIDRDLITGIDADRAKQNLVKFLVSFGRLSGVRVLAEGIEHRDELAALMDLGVVYGQGYHLARPGTIGSDIDPEVRGWLVARSEQQAFGRLADPRRVPLSRFGKPASVMPGSMSVAAAASEILRDRPCPGYVLTAQGRIVGWCGREQLLRAAGDRRSFLPVESIASRDCVIIDPDIPVADALEAAASRIASMRGEPIVLAAGSEVHGIVTIADLLSAAAAAVHEITLHTAPITGLPTRAKADEHIRTLIRLESGNAEHAAPRSTARRFDAAMVDLRGFAVFNERQGIDLGDDLLRRLAALLRRCFLDENAIHTRIFVAHVGDDRFLMSGPTGSIRPRLDRLATEFALTEGETGVGLRAFFLPGVFACVRGPQEIYALIDRARHDAEPGKIGVIDLGDGQVRLSA
jgi:EAL domain-containing protein (putative c-di-GMP-specific phosphodiesterase class I)/GGDEF domain-containing protein